MTTDNIYPHLAGTSTLLRVMNGCHFIVVLPQGLPTAEQGRRLLNLEKALRAAVDPQAEVFLEPMQDRNAVRRFRGVTLE